MEIIKGSALEPKTEGPKIIMHIVNDVGAWGKGFVVALSEKWPETEFAYKEWFKTTDFGLGKVMSVPVGDDIWVCHMVAQLGSHKIVDEPGRNRVYYKYLVDCLLEVFNFAQHIGATVHAPQFGSNLDVREWAVIGPMVETYSGEIPVTIYEI